MTRRISKSYGGTHFHASSIGPCERPWKRGRAHVYFYDEDEVVLQNFGLEWSWGARFCGIELGLNAVDGDHGIKLFAGIPWVLSVWFTVEKLPKWLQHRLPGHWHASSWRPGTDFWWAEQRQIGMRVHDWTMWFSIWENPMEWNRSDPWWWRFNVDVLDLLLGRAKYSSRELEEGTCWIPMPEENYPAHYRIFESRWDRPRWFAKTMVRIEIEVEGDEGIPLPGKGTTSYNCDDDASYSITMPYNGSVADACAEYAHDIVRDRIKRCGRKVYP